MNSKAEETSNIILHVFIQWMEYQGELGNYLATSVEGTHRNIGHIPVSQQEEWAQALYLIRQQLEQNNNESRTTYTEHTPCTQEVV